MRALVAAGASLAAWLAAARALQPSVCQPVSRCGSAMARASHSGKYDPDGFDPERDTVGPGIYGGAVLRDDHGNPVIGRQYEDHNANPGPVYSGKGYSAMSRAIHSGPQAVKALLAQDPSLKEEVTTGGARPLHVCGMSRRGQLSAQTLIDAGADINAYDTYGYTPLHRMASNNLAAGAEALLAAGADPHVRSAEPFPGKETPVEIARALRAYDVIFLFQRHLAALEAAGAGTSGGGGEQ